MADTTAASKIVERHKVLAFYGVPTDDGVKYYRMSKFTQLSHSKNPVEYSRQYVDEPFQQTDVVGFAPQYDYAFDKHTNLPVQKDIISITDGELLGDDAVRSIVLVDTVSNYIAHMRDYSIIPSTEGDNINIYTYSGSMKARGDKVNVIVFSTDNYQTITIGSVGEKND